MALFLFLSIRVRSVLCELLATRAGAHWDVYGPFGNDEDESAVGL